MSKDEAIPLVQYINRHDDRLRAEVHFITGTSPWQDVEALVLLTERGTQRSLPPLFHHEEYNRRFGHTSSMLKS